MTNRDFAQKRYPDIPTQGWLNSRDPSCQCVKAERVGKGGGKDGKKGMDDGIESNDYRDKRR